MADAQVGKLYVKIVPDAQDFQRETKRLAEAQGRAMEQSLAGSGKRAAASAADSIEDSIERVDKAAQRSTQRVSSALREARARDEREAVAAAARAANLAATVAERSARANVEVNRAAREQMYAELWNQTRDSQRLLADARARDEREAQASAVRVANASAIAAERAARANSAATTRLREQEYAALFDQIETEERLRARAAERVVESATARGFRLQQQQIAADLTRQIREVDSEVTRIESRGGWASRLMGDTGRAGRDTEGALQRAAKSYAFIGGGPLRGVASTLGLVGGQAAVAGGAVAALGTALVGAAVAAVGIGAGAVAYTAFAKSALESAGALEQQQAAFTTMLGSADKGAAMLQKVAKFAVETPFSTDDVATGAKRLMAYGFAAEDVIPILTDLGDAAGALGLDGGGLNRLITAFGQIRTTGKLQADEARQLAENGIPVWELLAKKMGVTTQEVMKLSSDGLIPAEDAIAALREGIQSSFGGGMSAQVNTFTGAMEKMRDSISTGLGLSLLPSLPTITAEMGQIGDSLMVATTALGTSLGTSLSTAFRAAQPAVSELITSLAGAGQQIIGQWTPTMTLLTTSLSSAFTNALPGIGALSAALSDVVTLASGSIGSLTDGFNRISQSIQSFSQIPGLSQLFFDLDRVGMAFSMLGHIADAAFLSLAVSLSTVSLMVAELTQSWAVMFAGLAQVPGMGWAQGVADALGQASDKAGEFAARMDGLAQRSKLSIEVKADITTAEAALAGIAASANTLSPEVKVKYGIDPAGIAQFNSTAINNLLGLKPEVLAKIGIDKSTLVSEIAAIRGVLDPLSTPVKATINADASGALSAAEAAQQALNDPSLADTLVTITGDPNGAITAAGTAKVALDAIKQAQPILIDATTSPVESKAAAATGILNAVRQYQPAPIDATPGQTALAAQQAQALIDSVRQNAPILLSADSSPTASEAAAAQALIEAVAQTAPAPIDADASPAMIVAAAAQQAIDGVQQNSPPAINADASPALTVAAAAQRAINAVEGKTVDLNANDNASGKVSGLASLLAGIPRQITVNIGTNVTGSVPSALAAPRLAPYPSGGGEVAPQGGVSPMGRIAAFATTTSVPRQAGAWQIPLGSMLGRLRAYYAEAASIIRDGMESIYATEYRYYRYLDVVRTNFARKQEDQLDARREQLEAQTTGLEGDALAARQAANAKELKALQRKLDDERRAYDWSIEDARIYYDEQRRLADALVQQLADMQDKMRGTVSWDQYLSPSSLIRNLDRNAAILTDYVANLAKLRASGLSKEAQAAFAEMDPLNAAKLAERLLSNPAAIADLNRAYAGFLAAGIKGSAAYITPQQIGGTVFAPPPVAASATRVAAGQGVVVDMTVMPSRPMDERQLAAAIGSELMWRVA